MPTLHFRTLLRRPALARLLLLVLLVLGAGCGGHDDAERRDLVEVPAPVLDAVEPSVREQIETARERLRRALDDRSADDRSADETISDELASAYGEMGRVYHAYEFLDAAEAAYTNARRLDPSSFRWTYLQALTREELGRKEEAIQSLTAALGLKPDDLPARVRRAALNKDLGLSEPAREELESVVADRDDLALAHYYLGQLASDRGDWDEAARRYERVLELQPAASRVRYPLSRVYQRLGRADDAKKSAQRSGNVDVTMEDPLLWQLSKLERGAASLVRRGAEAQIDGDWQTAAAAYREAVASDPSSVEARMSLGGALVQLGDLAAAEEHLRRATELDPTQALAWYNLAGVLRSKQRFEEALDAYAEALELSPEEDRFLLARAQTEIDAGRPEAARATYESLLRLHPDSADAVFGLAALDAAEGQLDESVAQLRSLLERDLDEQQRRLVWLRLGHLSARTGDPDQALAYYDRFLEASERDGSSNAAPALVAEAHLGRANLLGAQGRYGPALEAYRAAVALAPERTEAWLGGATARVLAGDWIGARRMLEEGLQATGGQVDLQHTLARLLATAPDPGARDGELALRLARAALDQGGPVDFAETVGMALAELGRWQEAVDWQQRVIDQLEAAGQVQRADAARALQQRYRDRRPVRQGEP